MASQQQIQGLQQSLCDQMTPLDLRDAEYAMLAEIESASGVHSYPEERAMVTVTTCCWIAGLYPIAVTPCAETTQLASLFKSFWMRAGRSPTLGEARALVAMIDATLLQEACCSGTRLLAAAPDPCAMR